MGVLDGLFGGALCGIVAAGWIFGLICILAAQYYLHYPTDPLPTKALIGSLLFLQLLNQMVITKMIYFYLVSSFGNSNALTFASWEYVAFIGIEAVTATLVQLYYAHRCFRLTHSWLILGTVVLLSMCQLAFGLGVMGVVAEVKSFEAQIPWTWIDIAWLSSSAACDVVLVACQVWVLLKNRSKARGTKRVIKVLVVYIVGTGALTSIESIVQMATFVAVGFNFAQSFLTFSASGLYVLSLMTNLSIRRSLHDVPIGTIIDVEGNVRLESLRFRRAANSAARTGEPQLTTMISLGPNGGFTTDSETYPQSSSSPTVDIKQPAQTHSYDG